MNYRITSEYWMRMAIEVAKASTCRADIGCVLIYRNVIVGIGYVGSVHGDTHCIPDPRAEHVENAHILVATDRQGSTKKGNTCIRTIHAEMNAVLKCTVRGSEADGWIHCYSTYQPCLDCTKVMLQIGVRKIFYMKPYKDSWRDVFMMELNNELRQSIEMKVVDV